MIRPIFLLVAVGVIASLASASFGSFGGVWTSSVVGADTVWQLTIFNDGSGGTGTNLKGFDFTITTSAPMIFQTNNDIDGDDPGNGSLDDVNIVGAPGSLGGLPFGSGLGSFMRIGNTEANAEVWIPSIQFTNINGNIGSATSLLYLSGDVPVGDKRPLWTNVTKWREAGAYVNSGLDASHGIKVANIVVPTGTFVFSNLDNDAIFISETGSFVEGPEPATLGTMLMGGMVLLRRRRRG